MNICEKLEELFQKLFDYNTEDEKLAIKAEILKICDELKDVPQNIKAIMIQGYSDDIDTYIKNPELNINSMMQLKKALSLRFEC